MISNALGNNGTLAAGGGGGGGGCCSTVRRSCTYSMEKNFSYKRRSSHDVVVGSNNNNDVEALTAKELNALSMEERERVFEEVNGISSIVEENPDFINKCLFALNEEINNVQHIDKSAYDRALMKHPYYVNNRSFRLMFLRAECFNIRKAARRFIKHFTSKVKLFGEDMLVKDITYDTLDKDDKDALLTGASQILPSYDQDGRYVMFMTYKLFNYKSWKNQFRSIWYQMMSTVTENESVQRKGMVMISYAVGLPNARNDIVEALQNAEMLNDSLPYRICAVHLCYDIPVLLPFISFVKSVIGKDHRLRFRSHYGSDVECQYKLMRHGIPQSILYVDPCGTFNKEKYLIDVENRKVIERSKSKKITLTVTEEEEEGEALSSKVDESLLLSSSQNNSITNTNSNTVDTFKTKQPLSSSTKTSLKETKTQNSIEIISYVGTMDVLIGKGGCRQKHPGNSKLSELIELKRQLYQTTTRKLEKTKISTSIVQQMKQTYGGRFLKRRCIENSNEWIEINDSEARDAISHRLRNKAPRRFTKDNLLSSLSSTSTTIDDSTTTTTTTTTTEINAIQKQDDEDASNSNQSRKRFKGNQ